MAAATRSPNLTRVPMILEPVLVIGVVVLALAAGFLNWPSRALANCSLGYGLAIDVAAGTPVTLSGLSICNTEARPMRITRVRLGYKNAPTITAYAVGAPTSGFDGVLEVGSLADHGFASDRREVPAGGSPLTSVGSLAVELVAPRGGVTFENLVIEYRDGIHHGETTIQVWVKFCDEVEESPGC